MNKYRKPSLPEVRDQLDDSEYYRTFSIWSAKEDEELIAMFVDQRLSQVEIAKRLCRTVGSIRERLRIHGHLTERANRSIDQFSDYIRNGVNPITGEKLTDSSAWQHPQILADLQRYADGKPSSRRPRKTARKVGGYNKNLTLSEHLVLSALMQKLYEYAPTAKKRHVDLLREYYSPRGEPKTLEEVGTAFHISRERVRQVREKYLKRIRNAILAGTFVKHGKKKRSLAVGYKHRPTTHFQQFEYLNTVLHKLAAEKWSDIDDSVTIENDEPQSVTRNIGDLISDDSREETAEQWRGIEDSIPDENLEREPEVRDLSSPNTEDLRNQDPQDFFRIESQKSFTPYKKNADKRSCAAPEKQDLLDLRIGNAADGRLLNHGFTITWEEIYEIKHKYYCGHDLERLENFFQRSRKSIDWILSEVIEDYQPHYL